MCAEPHARDLEPERPGSGDAAAPSAADRTPAAGEAPEIRSRDRGLGMGWFYALSVYASRVVALTFFEARFFDTRHVSRSGAVVLAGSHQSLLDPWLIGLSLARRACYLARDSLFRVPILGWLIRKYDSMPVPRESAAPRRSLEVCVRILEKGRALILFPEGTRSQDGRLQPLKRGISLIAKRSQAPVVPVLVSGAFAIWPRSRKFPLPGQVRLHFGEPVSLEPRESLDAFMERLAAAYRRLAFQWGIEEVIMESITAEAHSIVESPVSNGEGRQAPLEAAGAA